MDVKPPAAARAAEGSAGGAREAGAESPESRDLVIWHDLECGSYTADLSLWRRLARSRPRGAILDIGAGTGRVSLDLARTGCELIALDHDPALLAALDARAGELEIRTVCADARSFRLAGRPEIGLCVVPMQTVQLLGGPAGRLALLETAAAHVRPGGLIACAIVTEVETYDCRAGGPSPAPDRALHDGRLYASRPLRVQSRGQVIEIERERSGPGGTVERSLVELDRLDGDELAREGASLGLSVLPLLRIEATREHSGSEVVVLRV